RLTLCADPDDLPRYDDAFAQWFAAAPAGPKPATMRRQTQARIAALAEEQLAGGESGAESDELRVAASDAEVLRQRELSELTTAERKHLRELLAVLRPE